MNPVDLVPAGLTGAAFWLPLIFVCLMGLAMLLYVILDGYDLGVGSGCSAPNPRSGTG